MKKDNKIITSISALYKQNIISYSPKHLYINVLFGANPNSYDKEKYKISVETPSTFGVGSIKFEDESIMYCPERLFIDLNKFPLEATVKNEAIKNLEKIMNPELVKKYYEKLKTKRRGIDKNQIVYYLEKNLMMIKEILEESSDRKTVIREYIMAIVSKKEFPVCIIKGGSSIELYTSISRTTLDIDAHSGKKAIESIIASLKNQDNFLYFEIEDEKNVKFDKRIIKLNLIPKTRKLTSQKYLKGIKIPISLNKTYSEKELIQIIETYKLTKRLLKKINNVSVIVFSREMLLAEKYQSLILKPSQTKRTKDLIDLKILWKDDINFFNFLKWFYRKTSFQRNNIKDKEKINNIIKANKDLELKMIAKNFDDAIEMYGVNYTYQECLKIYKNISNKIIEFHEKGIHS